MYLDCILAASTGSSLDQGVAGVDDAADPVGVSVKLRLKRLMLLMLTLTETGRNTERM